LSSKQRGRLVRQIAAATHTDPFGGSEFPGVRGSQR